MDTEKVKNIYDSYIDRLNEILHAKGQKAVNEEIYKIQSFIYECMMHNILTNEEYEYLYVSFKNCIELKMVMK